MKNPWFEFDWNSSSQIHPQDQSHVDAYNFELSKSATKNLNVLSLIHAPLPFFGSIEAKVVILLANPGIGPGEEIPDESFTQLRLLDSARKHQTLEEHFIYISEGMKGTEGHKWWTSKLKALTSESSIQLVHESLMAVEFHPYHSVNFSVLPITLPTQNYTFELVRRKVAEGALFVIGRHLQGWFTAVPELRNANYVMFKSRNAALTPGNLNDDGFKKVLAAMSNS